ncbi:glycosyltransferase family 39 protein [Candidatus Woesearchaeota archaeon]|nr:glycosyltransferase family 39 protein [Candidatus Woesearchaeota archaeon]
MKARQILLLLGILVVVLLANLAIPLLTDNLSLKAYDTVREVENIQEKGIIIVNDPLTPATQTILKSPFFYYLTAFFTLFLPGVLAYKIVPAILSVISAFLVFLIVKKLTKNNVGASFSAMLSGFIPVSYSLLVNNASSYSLVMPMFLLLIYSFINIEKRSYQALFLASIILSRLTHPAMIIFIISLLVYLLIIRLEGLQQKRAELEVVLFSTFFFLWLLFLWYKKALLFHGPSVIWQNLPTQLLTNDFQSTNLLRAMIQIGFIPFMLGIYEIYLSFFKRKNRHTYLLIAFIITNTALLWFRLIPTQVALMFLGLGFAIMAGYSFERFNNFLDNSKIEPYKKIILIGVSILIIITSVMPSISIAAKESKNVVTVQELKALEWLEKMPLNATVLALPQEGNLIMAIAKKPVLLNDNYLLVPDVNDRYNSTRIIYSTMLETQALLQLNKHDVKIIYLSPRTKAAYGENLISYVSDDICFRKWYDDTIQIYEVKCTITT